MNNTLNQKLQQLGVMMLVNEILSEFAHRQVALTNTYNTVLATALGEISDKALQLVANVTSELQAMEPPRPLIAMLTSIDCADPVQWAGWIHQELEARINDQVTTGRPDDSE
jgi:hypothetical protein